jgi:hypothetical protein
MRQRNLLRGTHSAYNAFHSPGGLRHFLLSDIHVSLCQVKNALLPGALPRARTNVGNHLSSDCLSAWSLPAQNQTSIRCLGSQGPSQKIEFVFSASPETVRGEPQEGDDLHRSLGQEQDLAVCVLSDPWFSRFSELHLEGRSGDPHSFLAGGLQSGPRPSRARLSRRSEPLTVRTALR